MVKPDFLGIGAQKCASTWLYRMLAAHPEVGVSQEKEVDFFSFHFDHGYQWYERKFEDCQNKSSAGEISPSYFCEPAVPERVRQYIPDARILVSFREPIQRALSNHRHEVRVGHFTGAELSFEAGLKNNPMYIDQGRYASHLKRWLRYFPSEQILVLLMDDIEKDPSACAKKVYEFLGVDPAFEPTELLERFNKSYANRSRKLLGIKEALYNLTRMPGGGWIWKAATSLGLRNLYRNVNKVSSELVIPAPAERTLDELRSEFLPEVRELSELIGRPLDSWLS